MQPSEALLGSIEAVAAGGRAVVSADNSVIIAMMQETAKHGRSATFYVTPAQAGAFFRWYWTPRRVKEIGMEQVSKEEREKIERELGVKDMGPWYSNRIQCSCGGGYGAFEFVQQGLREHGRDWLGVAVEMKDASIVRINPTQTAFCPVCNAILIINHDYWMTMPNGTLSYGCCSGEI